MTTCNWPLVENLLNRLEQRKINILSPDLTKEIVEVVESGSCSLEQLPGKVPSDVGRYRDD